MILGVDCFIYLVLWYADLLRSLRLKMILFYAIIMIMILCIDCFIYLVLWYADLLRFLRSKKIFMLLRLRLFYVS